MVGGKGCNGVEWGMEYEAAGQAWWGYDGVEGGRGFEAIARA